MHQDLCHEGIASVCACVGSHPEIVTDGGKARMLWDLHCSAGAVFPISALAVGHKAELGAGCCQVLCITAVPKLLPAQSDGEIQVLPLCLSKLEDYGCLNNCLEYCLWVAFTNSTQPGLWLFFSLHSLFIGCLPLAKDTSDAKDGSD